MNIRAGILTCIAVTLLLFIAATASPGFASRYDSPRVVNPEGYLAQNNTPDKEKSSLTEAQEQEFRRIRRWYDDIMKYDSSVTAFMNAYNQALALKNASGFGSLLQAQPYIDEMKEHLSRIQAIIPDEMMKAGHMKLLSAFNMMLQGLVLTAPSAQIQSQAQQDLVIGQNELAKWKTEYNATRNRFIKSLNI
jgi:hypothetical protein